MADLNSTTINGTLRVTGDLVVDGVPDNVYKYIPIKNGTAVEYYEMSFQNNDPSTGVMIFTKKIFSEE